MQVLVVEPERRPEAREIDGSLKTMQGIVGGPIQPIYLGDSVVLVCNDEGKFMNFKANRALRDRNGQMKCSGAWMAISSVCRRYQMLNCQIEFEKGFLL